LPCQAHCKGHQNVLSFKGLNKQARRYVSQYKTLADALESEVLTEMAGTFFGARKAVDDLLDDFNTHVEQLRGLSDRVY